MQDDGHVKEKQLWGKTSRQRTARKSTSGHFRTCTRNLWRSARADNFSCTSSSVSLEWTQQGRQQSTQRECSELLTKTGWEIEAVWGQRVETWPHSHFSCLSQDNTIDFLEFVAALNLVFRGDLEHKLRWSFKVYDRDNNGFVDRTELQSIIDVSLSIYTYLTSLLYTCSAYNEAYYDLIFWFHTLWLCISSVSWSAASHVYTVSTFFLFRHLVNDIITSLSCFQSIHRIKKDSGSQLTVDEVVDRIFQAADSDGDGDYLFISSLMEGRFENTNPLFWTLTCLTGYISIEEFIRGAQQDPWLLNMLKLDMNPAGWVMEQRRKSAHFWNIRACWPVSTLATGKQSGTNYSSNHKD